MIQSLQGDFSKYSNHEWFHVEEVFPGIRGFAEFHNEQEVISYMIIGDENILFIDAGMGIGNTKELGINILGSGAMDKEILLTFTHSHLDHTGGARYFSSDMIYIYDHPRMYEVANNGVVGDKFFEFASEIDIPKFALDGSVYRVPAFHYHKILYDKDFIDIGSIQLQIIHTPGHSSDSISYYDKQNKILFCGDIAYCGPIYVYLESASLEDYIQTVDDLSSLEIEHIFCGHNEYEINPDFFKKLKQKFTHKTIDEIRSSAGSNGEVIVAEYIGKQTHKNRICKICLQ